MLRPSLLLRALAAAALLASACRGRMPAPSNQTPVILVSIDTLRSDHLPAYGYRGVETPNIDRFRADAVQYDDAWSHVPLTLPSHATMLTGQLPATTGIRDNIGFRLDPNVATVPELLKKNGYATGAAVSAYVLRKEGGLARGFDFYDDDVDPANAATNLGRVQRKGTETAAVAEKWIDGHSSKPFFFFLHLYEPHTPYDPPEPYRSRAKLAYDGEIAYVDSIFGDFIDHLKSAGLYDQALIILVSDHGEGLGEHGEPEHGVLLHRETLQVPLFVKLPRSADAGTHVKANVGLVDVAATILQQTSTQVAKIDGESLLAPLTDPKSPARAVYSETYFPKFHYGWSDLHSLVRNGRHFIQAPKPELYDYLADRGETKNLVEAERRSFVAMREEIRPLIREAAKPSAVSAEDQAKLAALGYVGSTAVPDDGEALPDPKDRIQTVGALRDAFSLYEQGKYAEALPLWQSLARDNGRMVDVWDMMSRTLDQLGRPAEAIEAAKQALRLSPQTTHLALMIARMSIDLGRLDEAEKHAELAVSTEPGSAHDVLARIALARGDANGAEQHARAALATRDEALAMTTMARVAMSRQQYPQAVDWCDRAAALVAKRNGTSVKGLFFLRGDALARMGRYPEAEASFRKEIQFFPKSPDAYKNLILLYATEGKNGEATQLVYDLVKQAPVPASYAAIATTLQTIGDVNGARYWLAQGLRAYPNDVSLRKLARG